MYIPLISKVLFHFNKDTITGNCFSTFVKDRILINCSFEINTINKILVNNPIEIKLIRNHYNRDNIQCIYFLYNNIKITEPNYGFQIDLAILR